MIPRPVSDRAPLDVGRTVAAGVVRHRLALGVQWLDATSDMPVTSPWVSELQAVGTRACVQRLAVHSSARHALVHRGRLARLLALGASDKVAHPPADDAGDPTLCELLGWGQSQAGADAYAVHRDPRRHVPRRLALTPVQDAGVPPVSRANVRLAWLWPGAAYPLTGNSTALRGRVRRGPTPEQATPVPWARVVVTRRLSHPDLAAEVQVGWGHGDDRGEFLVLLGPSAVPGGAALQRRLELHVWVFLPPAGPFDPEQPLASLPLEVAGAAGSPAERAVLRGAQPPAGYLRQDPVGVDVALGRVVTLDEQALCFS